MNIVKKLRELSRGATAAPWEYINDVISGDDYNETDWELIAAMRNNFEAMLDVIEAVAYARSVQKDYVENVTTLYTLEDVDEAFKRVDEKLAKLEAGGDE